ncbi:DUF5071 domain-containing protein [Neobacillus soli]|uniref:DUF5071 domain-containing protein n=1 Tax=Neobacillus soli TaxID=220688 RepID=UPI000826996F|nr:DUF5071 domain-containing protein [Neobacillus soli]
MENFYEILPKDKFDIESVEKIRKLSRVEIISLFPNLLEWIQDMNWVIAPKVAELLLDFPNELVLLIRNVFETEDNVWKFWCLEVLVKYLPTESKMVLRNDLIRLAKTPSEEEKLEEVDVIAKEILEQL